LPLKIESYTSLAFSSHLAVTVTTGLLSSHGQFTSKWECRCFFSNEPLLSREHVKGTKRFIVLYCHCCYLRDLYSPLNNKARGAVIVHTPPLSSFLSFVFTVYLVLFSCKVIELKRLAASGQGRFRHRTLRLQELQLQRSRARQTRQI